MTDFHLILIQILSALVTITTLSVAELYTIDTQRPATYDGYEKNIEAYIKSNEDNEFFTPIRHDDMDPIKGGSPGNCQWVTQIVKPYAISLGNESFVVMQSEAFEQKIKVTRCIESDIEKPCYEEFGLDQFDMKSICTETYSLVRLYVCKKECEEIKERSIYIPICCVCSVENK